MVGNRQALILTLALCSASAAIADSRIDAVLPPSAFPAELKASTTVSRTFVPSGSDWHISWPEKDVFEARLIHENVDPTRTWDARIGRGGQLFSLRGTFGEAMAPQWRDNREGPVGRETESSAWNDEVFQIVAVDTASNDRGKLTGHSYFMHGSGPYTKGRAGMTRPFYNPLLASGLGSEPGSYVAVNWMQQAHVPTPHLSHAITYNKFRDVGDGILEVTSAVYNFGPTGLNFFNMPWGGVRHSNFGTYRLRKGGVLQPTAGASFSKTSIPLNETDGWLVFAGHEGDKAKAVGLVVGRDLPKPLPGQIRPSVIRYGIAGNGIDPGLGPTKWRNYDVVEVIRHVAVPAGQGLWARYYLVMGEQADVERRIAQHRLADKASHGPLDIARADSPRIAWYGPDDARMSNDASSGALRFRLFAHPVRDTIPLFRLKGADDRVRVTTDPYALSERETIAGTSMLKPFDGRTTGWELLGYLDRPSPEPAAGGATTPVATASERSTTIELNNEAHGARRLDSDAVGKVLTTATDRQRRSWTLVALGQGDYRIGQPSTNLWLTATSPTDVKLAPSSGGSDQLWRMASAAGSPGSYFIASKSQAVVLIAMDGSAGFAVRLAPASKTGAWTRWRLALVK